MDEFEMALFAKDNKVCRVFFTDPGVCVVVDMEGAGVIGVDLTTSDPP